MAMSLTPMLQLRQMRVEQSAAVGVGLVVGVGHLFYEEIEKEVFALIGEFAVGVAPFAVILVERAVGLVTDERIVVERHSAALANQRLRRTQERVDGHIELLGESFEHFGVGLGFACLPTTYCLTADI